MVKAYVFLEYDDERIILAAHDEAFLTNGLNKIFEPIANDECRSCRDSVETITHLFSSFPKILAEGRYTTRHNNVCRTILWRQYQIHRYEAHDMFWKHDPWSFLENQNAKIANDSLVPVLRHVMDSALRPYIVLMD